MQQHRSRLFACGREAYGLTGLIALLVLSACSGSTGSAPARPPLPPTSGSQAGAAASRGAPSAQPLASDGEFGERGHIVIADQFNNRVIEIDPPSHRIVWQFGNGSNVPGPHSIVGTNDAERFGTFTLIAGTGAPPGTEPGCGGQFGCVDNRVILVNRAGTIVWQYGQGGVIGAGPNQLNTPVFSLRLPNRHVLIVDQGNERVIEVTRGKKIVWQYGMTGVTGSGPNQLNNPNSAELLDNGNVLIADENNNRVIEVTRAKNIVWQYPDPVDTSKINGAAFASRLPNGNTLITDSNNNRIVEIDGTKNVVWTYATNTDPGSNQTPLPTRAVRLANGHTLISDQFNHRVIEVDHAMPAHIVFTQGMLNVAGNGPNQLNGPYDAKVIGDFTGLTPPTGQDQQGDETQVLEN